MCVGTTRREKEERKKNAHEFGCKEWSTKRHIIELLSPTTVQVMTTKIIKATKTNVRSLARQPSISIRIVKWLLTVRKKWVFDTQKQHHLFVSAPVWVARASHLQATVCVRTNSIYFEISLWKIYVYIISFRCGRCEQVEPVICRNSLFFHLN